MNLIENLGLQRCKAIVDGAPMWASGYSIQSRGYFIGSIWAEETEFYVDDLRTAISDHERTDNCTDIRNHISNNTKVIDR